MLITNTNYNNNVISSHSNNRNPTA